MDINKTKEVVLLQQFFFRHGHLNVPNFPEYEALYHFCNTLRTSRRRLPAILVESLDSMGFRWNLHLSNDLRWFYHYEELKKFYEEFGHSRVSDRKGEYNSLRVWVLRQRRNESKLSDEQKKLLRKVKFAWSEDIKEQKKKYWMDMFEKLKAFYKKHGHSNVPDRYKLNEQLGRWVSTVRYSESILEDWKRKLLKTVKFNYRADIKKAKLSKRNQSFNELKLFYKKYGHANVPEEYKDHKLAIFVSYLRSKPNRVSAEEKKLLKQWNFLFTDEIREKREKQWLQYVKTLKEFKAKFGHCRVSSVYTDLRLAKWVAIQRKHKKEGRLRADREKILRAIGFSFYEDVAIHLEEKWMDSYKKLIAFKKKYGTTSVPESYPDKKLVYWVSHQRAKKSTMPRNRKVLLNKIDFVWRVKL
jgi:hypothetical protein